MQIRQYVKFLLVGLLLSIACAEQRPFAPSEPVRLEYRAPFENREAEELALWLSEELLAPESLYVRVKTDLQAIRDSWGDSAPEIRYLTFLMPMIPGGVTLRVEKIARERMKSGLDRDFDSLNALFNAESIGFDSRFGDLVDVRFGHLWNPCHLMQSYAKLDGVVSVYGNGIARYGGWSFNVTQKADSIFYIFQDGWGDCPAGCIVRRYRCFATTGESQEFWGEWISNSGTDHPHWFYLLDLARSAFSRCAPIDLTPKDRMSPARVENLQIIGDPIGATANLWFTLPGDDGWEGRAKEFTIKVSNEPLTDSNWSEATFSSKTYGAGLPESDTLIAIPVDGRQTNFIAVRVHDGSGNWSKTSNNAVFRNIRLNGWTYYTSDNSPLPDNRIRAMLSDSRGRMWIGTFDGLVCKDGEQWKVYQTSNSGIPYDLINSIAEAPDGAIWVGTPRGLGRFDGDQWQSFTKSNSSIPKEEITAVAVGDDGSVWLGYGQFGIVRYENETWTTYNSTNSPLGTVSVNALFVDSRSDLWIGTNWGVNRFDGVNWTSFDPLNSGLGGHSSAQFLEDFEGKIWCASPTGAVSWFDGVAWTSHKILSWQARSLAQSDDGTLWIGAAGGLWRHKSDDWFGFSGATSGLPTNHCTALIADGPHTLWIGTADKGLCRWDLKAAKLNQATNFSQSDK